MCRKHDTLNNSYLSRKDRGFALRAAVFPKIWQDSNPDCCDSACVTDVAGQDQRGLGEQVHHGAVAQSNNIRIRLKLRFVNYSISFSNVLS